MIRRHLEERLLRSLEQRPVVLLAGACQVGKTTLVQAMAKGSWPATFVSLDDRTVLDSALTNPEDLIRSAGAPLIVDEVQRAPGLLRAIKRAVDRDPKPGRFLLTASANGPALARAVESLGHHVALHRLYPLSWNECLERGPSDVIDLLFSPQPPVKVFEALPPVAPPERLDEIRRLLVSGGLPGALLMDSQEARRSWFESYRQSYVERDLRNLANVKHMPDFNRLMKALAQRTSHVLNLSELARDVSLPLTTARRYYFLLDQTYQIGTLAGRPIRQGGGRGKRPKLYLQDTGMACHLGAMESWEDLERRSRIEALLETWIHWELKKLLSLATRPTSLTHWRTQPGRTVNFVLGRGAEAIGMDVTWNTIFTQRNLRGLNACRQSWGTGWKLSVLLYGGTESVGIDKNTWALPFGVLCGRESYGGAY